MPEVPYQYFMTVSPLDGFLYVSDQQARRIVRVKTMGSVRHLASNSAVVAGSGEQCYPGDAARCGDGAPAVSAKLFHPKGATPAAAGVRVYLRIHVLVFLHMWNLYHVPV